ncbi:high-affinity nicotinic acid transporter [Histoplasma capsulatum var. duboisii H88]|uniref:High-affinity nicotinic acid transporter n=2 Tax=Ajellomyces capsulatus TaxID=5037 RepID=F0URL4_AJEC8|nr:high-affinity nicotinic acid transporter [Histoplasma capsulatum H143]EGC48541.1 high-affinity nicotinic acid transporter [Histoplasma capsulatum var. duboisii H88]QSS50552.1 high-affinity nicotinic acid transporter [Histoplasma capsulatum var. duboisii H88]
METQPLLAPRRGIADALDPEIMSTKPHREDTGPSAYGQIDPVIERRVVRKLDQRVPTLLGFLYLLSFLDRSNIGNARIAGMEEDLQLDGNRYEWLLTIFYISYLAFQFQGLMWKIVPPHKWAAFTVLGWGIIATCQAAVFSWKAEMGLRFLLGVTEAGFGPGIPFLLSCFYRRHELGLRCGLFVSAAPLASTFAGTLAYGITSAHTKLASWRLLFLVEGIPTILMVPAVLRFLPDSPAKAKFLNEEEKAVARARALRQVGAVDRIGGVSWKEIGETLLDVKSWLVALMYFSCNVSYSSLPVFLPSILRDMGFTSINAQGLSAPPYFLSFLTSVFTPWIADRYQQRGLMIAFLSIVGCTGYILLATCSAVSSRYIGVWMAASGVFPCIANILPWVLNNQGSDTRRGMGIIILNLIGQCGPLLGSNIFPASDGPSYVRGQAICAAFMGFNCFLALLLRTLLAKQNRELDRRYGTLAERAQQLEETGQLVVAEENYGPDYRFVL